MRVFVFLLMWGLVFATTLPAVGTSSGGGSSSSGSSSGSASSTSKSPISAFTAVEWYEKGFEASEAEKYAEAIQSFKNAVALDPKYAEAYNMLGFCTRKTGNARGAFPYYEKALSLRPDFPEAREYYGEAQLQAGNVAKAVQQYLILYKAGSEEAAELLEKIDEYVNK